MANEVRIKQVAVMYVTIFDRIPTINELDTYLNLNQNIKLEVISSMMMANSPLKSTLLSQDTKDVVKDLFQSIFGYTEGQMNTIIAQQEQVALDGGTDGFQYWVNELVNNPTVINVNTLTIALLNGADANNFARAINVDEVKSSVNNYAKEYNMNIQIDQFIDDNIQETVESIESTTPPVIITPPSDSSNIGEGKPLYVESKVSTDEGNDGTIDYVSEYTYSFGNGALNQYSNGYLETQYIYDLNGNMIEERNLDSDGTVYSTTSYTYNSNGQMITLVENSNDGVTIGGSFSWSSNSVSLNAVLTYAGMVSNFAAVGTGLNAQKNAPLKLEAYIDDELESISYYSYDSNGNETKMLEDEDADGTIDYTYYTEWVLLG